MSIIDRTLNIYRNVKLGITDGKGEAIIYFNRSNVGYVTGNSLKELLTNIAAVMKSSQVEKSIISGRFTAIDDIKGVFGSIPINSILGVSDEVISDIEKNISPDGLWFDLTRLSEGKLRIDGEIRGIGNINILADTFADIITSLQKLLKNHHNLNYTS